MLVLASTHIISKATATPLDSYLILPIAPAAHSFL
jgi:hypothetical protein